MKKILGLLLIILCHNFLIAQNCYSVSDNSYYSFGNDGYTNQILKGEKLLLPEKPDFYCDTGIEDAGPSYIKLIYKNQKVYCLTENLEILSSEKLFKDNTLRRIIPVYYFEILMKNEPKKIYDFQPKWNYFSDKWNPDYHYGETFESSFTPESFMISNLFVHMNFRNVYLTKKIEFINGKYILNLFRNDKFVENIPYPDSYLKYANQSELKLFVQFDGDFVSIWVNSLNEFMGKYVVIDEATYKEIAKFVRNGNCNLSKVTWPRHADGSCDFDGIKKTAAVITENVTPSTNVALKKTMSVKENLKLRSGEATSTQVLTVMSAGTKVKILELGKAETIDGISSNWVKVEVQKGAKDREGKPIKAGLIGWCYGGYLE